MFKSYAQDLSIEKLCLPFVIFDIEVTQQPMFSDSLHTGAISEAFQFGHIKSEK